MFIDMAFICVAITALLLINVKLLMRTGHSANGYSLYSCSILSRQIYLPVILSRSPIQRIQMVHWYRRLLLFISIWYYAPDKLSILL